MTFKANDRIYETSVTTGAGDYTLAGAQTGFQSFSAWGANNEGEYFATDDTNWESGIGKYITGPARLQRVTILESSNGGAAVNWGAGTRKLRSGKPAAMALPRALSLSVAGGAGTTVLTSDQANKEMLEFTGALTGNRVMEVDATVRAWAAVYNNTTGAFSLTFKVTGQTGVAIEQGKRVPAHCDGVDVRRSDDEPASDTLAGKVELATQAEQETASDVLRAVTPGRQQFHPSAAKGWAQATSAGVVSSSYNLTSVTDDGVGLITFTWATDFSSGNYNAVGSLVINFGATAATTYACGIDVTNFLAGITHMTASRVSDGALIDPNYWMIAVHGDQ